MACKGGKLSCAVGVWRRQYSCTLALLRDIVLAICSAHHVWEGVRNKKGNIIGTRCSGLIEWLLLQNFLKGIKIAASKNKAFPSSDGDEGTGNSNLNFCCIFKYFSLTREGQNQRPVDLETEIQGLSLIYPSSLLHLWK